MWWIMPDSSFMATGTGGQQLRIFPARKLVLMNRVFTGSGLQRSLWWIWGGRVNNSNTDELLRRLETDLTEIRGSPSRAGGHDRSTDHVEAEPQQRDAPPRR
jgi:hypothetical protein